MKAAFFDRDGTINVNFGHVYRCEDLEFISGTPEIIKGYNDVGVPVIVVTNQAGIAKGMYTVEDMHRFNTYMNRRLLEDYGAHIDAVYFCPHHPDFTGPCTCRKPQPGMFLQAAAELGISLSDSAMYGDKESDRVAAWEAGITKFYWINTPKNI